MMSGSVRFAAMGIFPEGSTTFKKDAFIEGVRKKTEAKFILVSFEQKVPGIFVPGLFLHNFFRIKRP